MKQGSGRVHFNVDQNDVKVNTAKPGRLIKSLSFVSTYGLKRSKSLNAADVLAAKAVNISDASELGKFPTVIQDTLLRAIEGNYKKLKDIILIFILILIITFIFINCNLNF